MIFFNLLIPKEKIVGIEINSQKLRMLYLEAEGSGKAIIRGKSEVDIDENVIISGQIKNAKKLSKAISDLKKEFKPKKFLSQFVIITIPQNNVYSEILEFPKTLDNDQLVEAISINAAEKLPLPLSQCYIDWEIIGDEKNNIQVLISLIPKKIADAYISVLKENGFELIALETYFLSIERAVSIPDEPLIFLHITDEGITSIIYKAKKAYLSQFETWQEISEGKIIKNINDLKYILKNKIERLKLYFESKYPESKIQKVFLISHGFNSGTLIKKIGKIGLPIEKAETKIDELENSDWIPTAGAAARAFIPRSEDNIISLLPIGTENLYESLKAISFSKSILFFLSSLSLFYVITFIGFYFFIASLEININKQLESKNSMPISQEYAKIEAETKEFNSLTKDYEKIQLEANTNNALVFKNINKLNMPGISLFSLSVNKQTKKISISGIASVRESLKVFKNKVNNSADFKNAKFSVPDISQNENISFGLVLDEKQ